MISDACRRIYTSLMSACASGPASGFNLGRTSAEQAAALFDELCASGHKPDVHAYAALLSTLAKAGMCARSL